MTTTTDIQEAMDHLVKLINQFESDNYDNYWEHHQKIIKRFLIHESEIILLPSEDRNVLEFSVGVVQTVPAFDFYAEFYDSKNFRADHIAKEERLIGMIRRSIDNGLNRYNHFPIAAMIDHLCAQLQQIKIDWPEYMEGFEDPI